MRSIVIAALASFSLPGCAKSGTAMYDVREHVVVGTELRMLVESSRRWRPFLSHSSKVADVKGWYVAIDLASEKPVAERSRVYGPLWEVDGERSFISYQAGANFSDRDAEMAAATPQCRFDVDGTLLRFSRGAKGDGVREALVEGKDGATWRPQGTVKPVVDRVPPMSEDRLETPSGRFCLLRQGPNVQLVDLFTGEVKDDPWLTGAFGRARSIKRFENVCWSLTDELDFLVVSPQPDWNDGSRDGVETFELDGQTLKRGEWGFYFRRPDAAPHLFRRKGAVDGDDTWNSPRDGFSFGGELVLYSFDDRHLRLWKPDGADAVVTELAPALEQKLKFGGSGARRAGTRSIDFFYDDRFGAGASDGSVGVVTWDTEKNATSDRSARLAELFEERDGEQRPKAAIPVK